MGSIEEIRDRLRMRELVRAQGIENPTRQADEDVAALLAEVDRLVDALAIAEAAGAELIRLRREHDVVRTAVEAEAERLRDDQASDRREIARLREEVRKARVTSAQTRLGRTQP